MISCRILKVTSPAFWSGVIMWSFIAIGNTSAEIAHMFSLEEMIGSSDTIVITQTAIEPSATPGGVVRVNLTVLQTIAGADVPPMISLTFVPKGMGILWGTSGSTRIVFLKHTNGKLQLSNLEHRTLPALNLPPKVNSDALGKVIAAEGEVLGSPNASEEDKREAISALEWCKDVRAIEALRMSLNDTSEVVRLEAVSRLALKGDVNAIRIAESVLIAPPSTLPDLVIHSLQVGIRDGAQSSATVLDVAKLLKVSDKFTREAAANALSHVQSNSIIEPLRQALSDPDIEVRCFAVMGLAKVTGQREHLANLITFHQNEAQYTNYWRQWQPPVE